MATLTGKNQCIEDKDSSFIVYESVLPEEEPILPAIILLRLPWGFAAVTIFRLLDGIPAR